MSTVADAAARLTAARAAYRAELSPVMTRDTEKRDRLAAEVDAAQEAYDEACAFDFGDVLMRRTGRGLDIRRCA